MKHIQFNFETMAKMVVGTMFTLILAVLIGLVVIGGSCTYYGIKLLRYEVNSRTETTNAVPTTLLVK